MIHKLQMYLKQISKEKLICSPLQVPLRNDDITLMEDSSKELFSLLLSEKYNEFFISKAQWNPKVAEQVKTSPLCMIGVDFHVTSEGPKLIEVNSNAGGFVPAAVWAHRNDPEHLEHVLSSFSSMFSDEYAAYSGNGSLRSCAIVDECPQNQFTSYDFSMTQDVLQASGVECDILDVHDNYSQCDLVYNRSCDFYFKSTLAQELKSFYLEDSVCVLPNPYAFSRVSDKRALLIIRDFMESYPHRLPALESVFLPCMDIGEFEQSGLRRAGWFFKPAMLYGGEGVFRGRKISMVKFRELLNQEFIVQAEALPGKIDFRGESFKFDVRVFVYRHQVMDLSVRVYQGRLTNFRTVNGGYASYRRV